MAFILNFNYVLMNGVCNKYKTILENVINNITPQMGY